MLGTCLLLSRGHGQPNGNDRSDQEEFRIHPFSPWIISNCRLPPVGTTSQLKMDQSNDGTALNMTIG